MTVGRGGWRHRKNQPKHPHSPASRGPRTPIRPSTGIPQVTASPGHGEPARPGSRTPTPWAGPARAAAVLLASDHCGGCAACW